MRFVVCKLYLNKKPECSSCHLSSQIAPCGFSQWPCGGSTNAGCCAQGSHEIFHFICPAVWVLAICLHLQRKKLRFGAQEGCLLSSSPSVAPAPLKLDRPQALLICTFRLGATEALAVGASLGSSPLSLHLLLSRVDFFCAACAFFYCLHHVPRSEYHHWLPGLSKNPLVSCLPHALLPPYCEV